MSTSQENQQTVEAALDYMERITLSLGPGQRTEKLDAARAALRDLVAQAELAREALGEIEHKATTRRTGVRMDGTETWAVPLAGEVAAIARDALARLDGAR